MILDSDHIHVHASYPKVELAVVGRLFDREFHTRPVCGADDSGSSAHEDSLEDALSRAGERAGRRAGRQESGQAGERAGRARRGGERSHHYLAFCAK
jgi:hypothetical protein